MSNSEDTKKPWGGRFEGPTDAFVERFTASIDFDKKLAAYDIRGSKAHAQMLTQVGILEADENQAIQQGLGEIESEIANGEMNWSISLEDVHMNIESALVAKIGPVGKKLHTARSRNDQVATDIRLYLRDKIDAIGAQIARVITNLIALAEREAETVMPGFTHLQTAQPIAFGHHMLAWAEMLFRDLERFQQCRARVNVLPLGAGALAGTTFPIDRELTAELLGFDKIAENSLDAVSDRDFAIEFTHCASLLMVHLSRMSEELVLWNSQQFAFVEIGDAFCTGSSMMPQKKNPDVPELIRGKSGRVVGHLMSLITLMKSQPLAYNKDNQEDKEPLFDTVDTVSDCLRAFGDLIPSLNVNHAAMRAAAEAGFATATDLADFLVRIGVPFRDAHEVVGLAVKLALENACDLKDLSLEQLRNLYPDMPNEVYQVLDTTQSMNARDHLGGTASAQVKAACQRATDRLAAMSR
ncbi:MAG: argininosuccinate lyase [Gammaproteobacteria bacterium]